MVEYISAGVNYMEKNDLIKNKQFKISYTIGEKKEYTSELIESMDGFYVYKDKTFIDLTFDSIKNQYLEIYTELLKAKRQANKTKSLFDYQKMEILEHVLKNIRVLNIDVPLFLGNITSFNMNKTDLEFMQLVLIHIGKNINVPGLDKKEKDTILKKDRRIK